MVSTTKIIVSNHTALKAKYGAGLAKVNQAIKAPVASDAARGIKTKLISIDDATAMKTVKAKAVMSASDEDQQPLEAGRRSRRPIGPPVVTPAGSAFP